MVNHISNAPGESSGHLYLIKVGGFLQAGSFLLSLQSKSILHNYDLETTVFFHLHHNSICKCFRIED